MTDLANDTVKPTAHFRFHGNLTSLVSSSGQECHTEYKFDGSPAIKDAIEAQGVPHTEVDLILVSGRAVDFSYRLQPADLIDVYPVGITPPGTDSLHLSAKPISPKFILDVHLGKLARRLRMLGFDCLYRNDYSDPEIIRQALVEERIILTRDRGILKHNRVEQGYLIRSSIPAEQIREVLFRYRLHERIRPLFRCPHCNNLLEQVSKKVVLSKLMPKTAKYYTQFHHCQGCGQVYWQGSHYEKIEDWMSRLKLEGNREEGSHDTKNI